MATERLNEIRTLCSRLNDAPRDSSVFSALMKLSLDVLPEMDVVRRNSRKDIRGLQSEDIPVSFSDGTQHPSSYFTIGYSPGFFGEEIWLEGRDLIASRDSPELDYIILKTKRAYVVGPKLPFSARINHQVYNYSR